MLGYFALFVVQDPRLAQTEARRQSMGAFLVLPSLRDLPAGLKIVEAAVNSLAGQAQVGGFVAAADTVGLKYRSYPGVTTVRQ